jgi:hypothetical protein
MTATRRLAAILAADVAGYSRLIGADCSSINVADGQDLPAGVSLGDFDGLMFSGSPLHIYDRAAEVTRQIATMPHSRCGRSRPEQVPTPPSSRFGTLLADWAPTLRNRWFADSAQEEAGFELVVQVRQAKLTRSCR